jgi:hypothetical protein
LAHDFLTCKSHKKLKLSYCQNLGISQAGS